MKLFILKNFQFIFHLVSMVINSFIYYLILGNPLDNPIFMNLLFIYLSYRSTKFSMRKSGLDEALEEALEEELKKHDL
jgi:hypothetical protein